MTELLGKLKFAQQFPQQLSQQLPQLVVQRSRMLFSTLSFDDSAFSSAFDTCCSQCSRMLFSPLSFDDSSAFSSAELVSVRKKTSFQLTDSRAW